MFSINIDKKLCEDEWGFYVDIENIDFVIKDNYKIISDKYYVKHNLILKDISLEYDYYLSKKKKDNYNTIEIETEINKFSFIKLLITCFVFCILCFAFCII